MCWAKSMSRILPNSSRLRSASCKAFGVGLHHGGQRRAVPFLLGADRGADVVRAYRVLPATGRREKAQRLREIVPQLFQLPAQEGIVPNEAGNNPPARAALRGHGWRWHRGSGAVSTSSAGSTSSSGSSMTRGADFAEEAETQLREIEARTIAVPGAGLPCQAVNSANRTKSVDTLPSSP